MKKYLGLFVFLFFAFTVQARHHPRWMRYPAISPDGKTIVFTYQGNLYKVSSNGGVARILFANGYYNCTPVWSRNGKYIAFAGNLHGNFDVFVIPANGGKEKRLTFHSTDEYPYDFFPGDQRVVFGAAKLDAVSNRQFPSEALGELYEVPVLGGRVQQILTTPAEDAKISPDGSFIVYHDRKGRENPWRKHQVSSIARDVWKYDVASKVHTQLSSFIGEDRSPVLGANNQLFYLSERSGSFNVYQMSQRDTSSQQITFFKDLPVRFLSIAKDNTLCFGYDGQVYIKRNNKEANRVNIVVDDVAQKKSEEIISVDKADEMALSPNGKEVAFTFRGDVFVSSIEGRQVKQITHTPGVAAALSFSPDGRKLVYASQRDSTWKIMETSLSNPEEHYFFSANAIKETPLIANEHENFQPQYSPDGKEMAYIENRNTLKILDVASKQFRTILGSDQLISRRDNDQYFRWSPDSKWLLLKYNQRGAGNTEVGLVSASGRGQLINISQNGYNDDAPKWMMGGCMILWNSNRKGLRSENRNTTQNDLYALYLDETAWYNYKLKQQKSLQDTVNNGKNNPISNGLLNEDAWRSRTVRLTSRSSFISDALVTKDGQHLYYLDKTDKDHDLFVLDLFTKKNQKLITLNLDEGTMTWDADEKNIFVLSDGRILKINPATKKVDTVVIETKMAIDLAAERAAMFEHVWRRTAETFYSGGLHGTPWHQLKPRYSRYLEDINNNIDFAEMLNELLGELNVSHTGATYQDRRKDGDETASLGVFYDLDYKGNGVKIKEIMAEGPLDIPFLKLKKGVIIEAVDGQVIHPDQDIDVYLNKKSGKEIKLQISDGAASREISVRAVSPSEEQDLLYKRWVKQNEDETISKTNGTIGYVHLYRMNDATYRDTYEKVIGKFSQCKAIIVDTRFNRGGDLAPELTMFLSGIKVRENTSDIFLNSVEPSSRWTKPSIVLANEANYSDGHCFVYDYQLLHMGKLVGMPVPGSCTWMNGQALQDPSMRYSVPTMGVKTLGGKYMENLQTEPDIRVMNEYGIVSEGRDQQLERAISEIQKD